MTRVVDNLFAQGARMVSEEAIELTLASLRAYWGEHEHVALAWSGGKDSTAALTLIVHLIEAGELPRPKKLYVFYAQTRQELLPIEVSAQLIIEKLLERDWIEFQEACRRRTTTRCAGVPGRSRLTR